MIEYLIYGSIIAFAVLIFFASRSCLFTEKWEHGICNDRVARRNKCTGAVQYLESGKWVNFDPAYWQCFVGGN